MKRRYPCASCGKKRPADEMIYSAHTRSRYCKSDIAGCDARAARRKRREKAAA